jgi:hypothetical protein
VCVLIWSGLVWSGLVWSGLLHIDTNKTLLLQSQEPIKLIMEALLLNPEHVRNQGANKRDTLDAAASARKRRIYPDRLLRTTGRNPVINMVVGILLQQAS